MDSASVISTLMNPYNGKSFHLASNGTINFLIDNSGTRIPVIDGIPNFLTLENTEGLNKKYQQFYDRISKLNDFAEYVYKLFIDLDELRSEWMADLEVKPGDKVLETSVGTGWNFRVLPDGAEYFGLDISRGMLKQCKQNSKKWKIPMHLFQGNAEFLPFKDETFDSVFHVGGINFFNNRKRAIHEMIRVAKPGTKIVIIDETEKRVAKQYRNTPFVKKYFSVRDCDSARLVAPLDLVPGIMEEKLVKLLDNGRMYQLSFRKPYANSTTNKTVSKERCVLAD